jgi:hypothetical protein
MPRKKMIFKCETCGETLETRQKLESHIKREHVGYICKYCGKKFDSGNGLGGHINLMHINKGMQPKKEQMFCNKDPIKFKQVHKAAMEKREEWRNDVSMTKQQEQLVLGGILGDASIGMGNKRSLNARVNFKQSIKQYEYCMWKYDIMKSLVKTPPTIENNGGYGDKIVTFNTMSMPCFTDIYNMVKRNGETTITTEHLDRITDSIALAVWIMDDGSNDKNNLLHISLGNRTEEEVKLLQSWMKREWDIYSTVTKNKEWTMNVLRQCESIKLKKLIEPHVIDSMKYKILHTI